MKETNRQEERTPTAAGEIRDHINPLPFSHQPGESNLTGVITITQPGQYPPLIGPLRYITNLLTFGSITESPFSFGIAAVPAIDYYCRLLFALSPTFRQLTQRAAVLTFTLPGTPSATRMPILVRRDPYRGRISRVEYPSCLNVA